MIGQHVAALDLLSVPKQQITGDNNVETAWLQHRKKSVNRLKTHMVWFHWCSDETENGLMAAKCPLSDQTIDSANPNCYFWVWFDVGNSLALHLRPESTQPCYKYIKKHDLK